MSCRCTSSWSVNCAPRSVKGGSAPGRRCPPAGVWLPSSGVSRGVVTTAFAQLAAEGYLDTRQARHRVARGVRAQTSPPPAPALVPRYAYDFAPGLPDLAGFPRDRWLRSVRAAWRRRRSILGYGDPRGVGELREALADYLGRSAAWSRTPSICWSAPASVRDCRSPVAGCADRASSGSRSRIPAGTRAPDRRGGGLAVTPIPVDAHGIDVRS